MVRTDIDRIIWYPFSDRPMLESRWYVPRLCDPFFLFPEESPDHRWHLFAHTWLGIVHFASTNGIRWESLKMVERGGRSPFVFREGGTWYLLYEKRETFCTSSAASRFEIRSSSDLILFSPAKTILSFDEVPFSEGRILYPRMFKVEKGYRLYFGAGVRKYDKVEVPLSFAAADGCSLHGPFENHRKVLVPDADAAWSNMAVGSVFPFAVRDGWVAVAAHNFWDREEGRVKSALVRLHSKDGESWQPAREPEMLSTPERGWASRFISSCCLRYKEDELCWYCFYGAGAPASFPFFRRESIGLLLGEDPVPRRINIPDFGN